MKRRVIATILTFCLICAGVTMTAAASQPSIVPLWDNASGVTLGLTKSGSNVNWCGTITGKSGTTKITATYILYKLTDGSYKFVDSWYKSGTSATLRSSGTASGCTSGTYKLSVSGVVTRNGVFK